MDARLVSVALLEVSVSVKDETMSSKISSVPEYAATFENWLDDEKDPARATVMNVVVMSPGLRTAADELVALISRDEGKLSVGSKCLEVVGVALMLDKSR